MGASIDEHKPFVPAYYGLGGNQARFRSRSNPTLRVWLWQRWPILLASALCGFMGVRWLTSSGKVNSAGDARLSSKVASKIKNGKVLLSDLVGVSIHLSEIAAHEIIEVKLGGTEDSHVKGKTDEGVDEPVTVADANSNGIFVNGLREFFPGIDILSEETEPEPVDLGISSVNGVQLEHDPWLDMKDLLITVDPLDATKEFTENLLQYVTTMVCVVHKGRPIAGIINEVFAKDEAAIWGVTLGDKEGTSPYNTVYGIQDSPLDVEAKAHNVMISRSHTGAGADVVSEFLPGKKPTFAGGSGYKALRVLKGDANAYVHVTKIKAWDVCAADAVVHASGGKFTNLKGQVLDYKKEDPLFKEGLIAAAHPKDHAWYVEKLAEVDMHKKKK